MNEKSIVGTQHPLVEAPLLAGMIRGELIESIKQLRGAFAHLDEMRRAGLIPTTLAGKALFDDTAARLTELSDKMEMLACLSETYAGQRDGNQERVFLYSLLSEVIGATKNPVRYLVKEPQNEVAPVYGNKHWLKLLLAYLVRELDASVSPAEKIVLTLRQLGSHMVLASGAETMSMAERKRTKPSQLPDGGLTASFCQRIVELHGGTLRLQFEEDREKKTLSGVTLSLPTSVEGQLATGHCAVCPLIHQIECYATDLAVLMDRCEQLEGERNRRA